jgi:hypothetical protein
MENKDNAFGSPRGIQFFFFKLFFDEILAYFWPLEILSAER